MGGECLEDLSGVPAWGELVLAAWGEALSALD